MTTLRVQLPWTDAVDQHELVKPKDVVARTLQLIIMGNLSFRSPLASMNYWADESQKHILRDEFQF